MRIGLYADNTVPLDVARLCDLLNARCESVEFIAGREQFRLAESVIKAPTEDARLPAGLRTEVGGFDLSCLATYVPYDNNHFFASRGRAVILSFHGWNALTDLSIANGFVYFMTSILASVAEVGDTHENNTGCLNDFLWDKTGVDVGMRAAYLCGECQQKAKAAGLVDDIQALLDFVSAASRRGADVLETTLPGPREDGAEWFDVFLSHNSDDKPAVRKLNEELKAAGLVTWFDEERLPPGMPWQVELEAAMERIRSACVCVGPSGFGPWQENETRAFLNRFSSELIPVVPLVLPAAPAVPTLPVFLGARTWVDLRENYEAKMEGLSSYLLGLRPGS